MFGDHVVGVPIDNPSTVILWEVMFRLVNGLQLTPKTSINNRVPPPTTYNLGRREYKEKQWRNLEDQNLGESISLHCSPVSMYDYEAIGTNEVELRLIENTEETQRKSGHLTEIKAIASVRHSHILHSIK
ncbi:hypothetical protein MTR_3g057920 [Medicago truncatula]|uniref:Uncharacterized protein n=1 Tax=Medicago truncatula TaxID=3880 RepID=G7ZXZ0_MEDTR|nr:hypothetical protein MTR_3g057920 [Medicago truncatula]